MRTHSMRSSGSGSRNRSDLFNIDFNRY
jgi:hypothetical protein